MARMSIDDQFLRDPRITRLAHRLGHGDPDLTRGKLLHVFALCYDHKTPFVSRDDIDTICPGMSDALVDPKINLAVEEPDGIRIRGADERVDYLRDQASRGRKGGVASGESRRGNKNEASASVPLEQTRSAASEATKQPRSLSIAPSPSPSPVPDSVPAREESTRPIPDATARRREADVAWRLHQAEREAVAAELGVKAPILASTDQSWKELLERIRESVVDGGEDLSQAIDRCRHVIAVAASEARRDRKLDWFGGRIWHKKNFDELAGRALPRSARAAPIQVVDLSRPGPNPFLDGSIEPSFTDEMIAQLDEHIRQSQE